MNDFKNLPPPEKNESTISNQFKPTPHMKVWLDTAVDLVTDSPTAISQKSGIDKSNWSQDKWLGKPGFEDWFYEEYKKKRRRWLPTLDEIGMRQAKKDYNYWRDMNKKVGENLDENTGSKIAVQFNNQVNSLEFFTDENKVASDTVPGSE